MRTVELDFTQNKKNIGEIGYVGEHNETELLITPPAELSEDSAVASYRVAFGVNGEIFHSAGIPAAETFTCLMWGDTTQSTSVTIQLEATDSDGELIAKSQMVVGCLAPSVSGEETDNQFTQPILNEIAANTAARHTHSNKAVLDAIIAPPVVEISETGTTSKYLPNELDALIQAGTALTYQTYPIIQYSSGLAFNFAYLEGTAVGTPKLCLKKVDNLGQISDNTDFGFSSVYIPLSVNGKAFISSNAVEVKADDITASNGWTPPYVNSVATKKYVDDNKGDKLPAVTSSDEDKVLTVNSSGQWAAALPQSGSGGSFIITITNVGGTPTADKTEAEIWQAWTDGQAVFVESGNYRVPMITANYENGEYEFYCVCADLDTTVITYYAYYSTSNGWELDMGSYVPPVTDVQDDNGVSVVNAGIVTLSDVALSGSYGDLKNLIDVSKGSGSHSLLFGATSNNTVQNAGIYGEAHGYGTSVGGSYGVAYGLNTSANEKGFIVGEYGDTPSNTRFSVANGTSNNAKSTAFNVYKNGDIEANASWTPSANNHLATKKYVDDSIPSVPVTDVQVNGSSVVSSGVASVSVPDISGCEVTSNKVTSLSNASTDTQYPSAKCVYDELGNKQNTLTAGTGISIVGDTISATGGGTEIQSDNNGYYFEV